MCVIVCAHVLVHVFSPNFFHIPGVINLGKNKTEDKGITIGAENKNVHPIMCVRSCVHVLVRVFSPASFHNPGIRNLGKNKTEDIGMTKMVDAYRAENKNEERISPEAPEAYNTSI